ncbi:hypothetical protein J5N97_018798 [Dioscorea zingiberensis]|uniref:TPX2 C-terminal domain-containing protein n=1 Tax=Dioscorea zingiberensis TaxID=325984 RepID=A0A9D5CDB3_9LILI|nr:hypothetical protein J5N97_018798 [Dioscorea zingiberensis]
MEKGEDITNSSSQEMEEKSEPNQELSENREEKLKNNKDESLQENEKEMPVESKQAEKNEENSKDSMEKKAKTAAKQTTKGKYTVPQPFSLSSEGRTSKERKSILQQSNPKLSKSLSLRADPQRSLRTIQTQTSLRLEKITEVRQRNTKSGSTLQKVIRTQTSVKVEKSVEVKHGGAKSVDCEQTEQQKESVNKKKDKDQEKEPETKRPLLASKPKSMNQVKGKVQETEENKTKKPNLNSKAKHNVEDLEIKLKKSSTFKASPLPSFYSKRSASLKPKQPEKDEEKEKSKLQKSATFKGSPMPNYYQKKTTTSQNPDLVVKSHVHSKPPTPNLRSKSLSHTESKKMDMTVKTTPQTIRESAKETIKKLFKGPWKVPNAKLAAETKNADQTSSVNTMPGNAEVSSNEGNNVGVAVDA